MQAINHCELSREAQKEMDGATFQEAVMQRAGEIVQSVVTGETVGKPHKLGAVNVVAEALANSIIEEGAKQLAGDMKIDLGKLKGLAARKHISSC